MVAGHARAGSLARSAECLCCWMFLDAQCQTFIRRSSAVRKGEEGTAVMIAGAVTNCNPGPVKASHGRYVCVVEDDEAIRELLCTLCESRGLSVEAYASIEAFMKTSDPQRTGCLVFDIESAEQDNLHLLRRLKTEGFNLPVILISGNPEIATVVQAMKLGAADFFDKPFDTHALLKRILNLTEHHNSMRTEPLC